jgi:hypothetical protein
MITHLSSNPRGYFKGLSAYMEMRSCSKTSVTGEPGSIVRVSASPGRTHKRLTHWTSETVYWSEAAGPPQGSTAAIYPGL